MAAACSTSPPPCAPAAHTHTHTTISRGVADRSAPTATNAHPSRSPAGVPDGPRIPRYERGRGGLKRTAALLATDRDTLRRTTSPHPAASPAARRPICPRRSRHAAVPTQSRQTPAELALAVAPIQSRSLSHPPTHPSSSPPVEPHGAAGMWVRGAHRVGLELGDELGVGGHVVVERHVGLLRASRGARRPAARSAPLVSARGREIACASGTA